MKRYCLIACLLSCALSNSQVIDFPDPVFKATLLASDATNTIAQQDVFPDLINIKIDANSDGEITVQEAALVSRLNVSNSDISSLVGFELFTSLESLHCENNNLTSISMGDVGSIENSQFYLYCENNQLTSIDFSELTRVLFLYADNNLLTGFNFDGFNYALLLSCSNNPISEIITGDYHYLIGIGCLNTPVTKIDIAGNNECEILNADNSPNLTALIIKDAVDIDADMGDTWGSFYFPNCPSLQYLCVSESRLEQAQVRLDQYGYQNCALNAYCNFAPGSPFYTVQGVNKLDLDGNGCENADLPYPNLRYYITNGNVAGTIPSTDGNYQIHVVAGSHTISPILESPEYFTAAPASFVASFPSQGSPLTQNFCITPNGSHNDLEVVITSTTPARPGFDSQYVISCRNKGTTIQNAGIAFAFNGALADVVSTLPAAVQSVDALTWNFNNLMPLETRNANVVLHHNAPNDTPPVNDGDVLTFTSSATADADETPADNTITLNQTVVNSYDPNDKTCLEGNTVTPDMAGKFVHYMIRFENTGTADAQNVVVADNIDPAKFDISTLVPITSSHPFVTRFLTGNKVEFIFESIDLPFDGANNDGYIAFKIKTKPTLTIGDTFSNAASIYFDYNFPIVTNTATTTISQLGVKDFEFEDVFIIYPNPVKDFLKLESKKMIEVTSMRIYNESGRLVLIKTGNERLFDVSDLTAGNYYLVVSSGMGNTASKFVKW